MTDDLTELGMEYDALLLKAEKSDQDWARIQAIEDQIARQFGYEWAQQHLETHRRYGS